MPLISTPLATLDDVRVAYEGDLPPQADDRVQWLLDLAVARLTRKRRNIVADVATGAVDPLLVSAALVNAVLRVVRAPGAFRSESAGEFSYTLNTAVASGLLAFTEEELADCTPASSSSPTSRRGVGTIAVHVPSWRLR